MELGQRIKAARLEAGLSQRQLCGSRMTRNMLSQIENGSARPSMSTLTFLAQALGKPVSYFLEEQAVTSPNRQCMLDARTALALEDLDGLRQALDGFREPDDVFYEERQMLEFLWRVRRGRQALEQGMEPYCVKLLQEAQEMNGLYITAQLRRECRVLLGLAGEQVPLDSQDDVLLVMARQAHTPQRQLEILGAAEDKTAPAWNAAAGDASYALGRYGDARGYYEKAPQTQAVYARLEDCCRELGDYKGAYEYAVLGRQKDRG